MPFKNARYQTGTHIDVLSVLLHTHTCRWLFASRNHLPSCCTPLVRHKLLCVAVRDVISTQFPRRRAAAPIRCPCRPPQRTLSPREVGEATVLAPEHGLQSTRDCAEAARAPPSTRHPNQRQSGRSVAGGAPLPALSPHFSIGILFLRISQRDAWMLG